MRLILQLGTQKVFVFPKDRFVEFNDLEQAAEFIADHVVEPQNLRALQNALRREDEYAQLLTVDISQLIVRVARLLLSGELRFLPDPGQLNPWRWSFAPTPTFDVEGQGLKLSLADLAMDGLKGKFPDPGYLDIIPDPIVPPEFPRMAAAEVEALDDEAFKAQSRMDLQRFIGSETPKEGAIAPAVLELARSEGSALGLIVGGAGGALIPLSLSGFDIPPASGVAPVFDRISGTQGEALGDEVGRVGLKLEDTLAGGGSERLPSELAAAFPEMVSSQGVALLTQTTDTTNAFTGLEGPMGDPPAPSLLSRELMSGGLRTGAELGNRTAGVNEDMQAITGGEGLVDADKSEVSAAMTRFSETNADLVGGNTAAVSNKLGSLLAGEDAEATRPSEISTAVSDFGRRNADVVGDNTAKVARDMDALLGPTPPSPPETDEENEAQPAPAPTPRVKIATIESNPAPLQGETNRSSQNFATDGVPPNVSKLVWEIEGPQAGKITFDVMEDKFLWRDPTHFFGISDGQETKVIRGESLYIARPNRSDDLFTVNVYGLLTRLCVARIQSQPSPMDGQENRSSVNFSTADIPENCRKLIWEVEGPQVDSVRFSVMEDRFLRSDLTHLKDIRPGHESEVIRDGSLYIARPIWADEAPFTVCVYAVLDD